MSFANDLIKLCKKHGVNLQGQLLVSDGKHTQEVEETDTAYWGSIRVRDMGAIVFRPNIPEEKFEHIKPSRKIHVASDIDGYTCPVTDKWIDGRRDHRENLKRTGCRLLEPGEKEQFVKERPREQERHAERAAEFLSDRIAERWDAPA